MKNEKSTKNPYATNKGGKIEAPVKQTNEPRASVTKKNDLRVK